jgi:CheY-like chemotaxis protein
MIPKPFQILLADDDEDDTFLFQEALLQISVHTSLVTAENGTELMVKLLAGESVPSLIFLDMNMPVKNGLECLLEIRENEKFANTPIVIFSTSVADTLIESAHKGGANLYVQKPTSFDNLIAIIENCILRATKFVATPQLDEFLMKNVVGK